MSKSDENVNGYIAMLDEPDVIMRKLRRAVTDSEALQAHLRRVDSQGAEKGWPAADWTVL